MRHKLSILLLLAIYALVSMPAYAFNGADPGVLIDDYNTGVDMDNVDGPVCAYIGINQNNNYVLFTAHEKPSGTDTQFSTWEISQSGTVIGIIDWATYTDALSFNDMGLIRVSDDHDWYLFGGMASDEIISMQITDDGAIDLTNTDSYGGSGKTGNWGCYILDNLILVSDYASNPVPFFIWRTLKIKYSDGTISVYDSWDATAHFMDGVSPILQDMDKMSSYDNTDIVRFITTNKYTGANPTGTWYVGIVYGNDLDPATDYGDIKPGLAGSGTMAYISGHVNEGRAFTRYLYDHTYVTYGYVNSAALGDNGDEDYGVEMVTFTPTSTTDCNIVTTGTGYIDTNAGTVYPSYTIIPYNTHFGYLWEDSRDTIEVRNVFNATDGAFDQTNISDTEIVYNNSDEEYLPYANELMACRLGTSSISAIAFNDRTDVGATNKLRIITYEHYFPPTVDTTLFSPLETTYNTVVDAAYTAGGSVDDIGSSEVTERGFCLNTIGYPKTSDYTVSSTGTWTVPFDFEEDILDLTAATNYYCRAYACNSSGTGYGDVMSSYGYPDYPYTIALWDFEPDEISSGTITDRTDNNHDISFTLLSNPGSLTVTMGSIDTYDWSYMPGTLGKLILFQDDPIDSDEFTPPTERTFTGLPGMEIINNLLDNANIPQAAFWLPFLSAIIVCFGLLGFWIGGQQNMLPMIIICGLGIAFGVTMRWFDWWYLPLYIIPAYALFVGQQSHGGSHL